MVRVLMLIGIEKKTYPISCFTMEAFDDQSGFLRSLCSTLEGFCTNPLVFGREKAS